MSMHERRDHELKVVEKTKEKLNEAGTRRIRT